MTNSQAIICIDDEPTILQSLQRELRSTLGNEVEIEIASGGGEALELLAELLEEGFDIPLIISDYVMPEMKGDEVLERIHRISPDSLKIMLTGQASFEGVTNAINGAQLYRYIAKPWEMDDLTLTVKEALKSYVQARQLAQQNIQLKAMNQELEQLNQAFVRFVPREFLECLNRDSIADVQLGDQVEQKMSILFADIRAFTRLSEAMTPPENFAFINQYLALMEPAIVQNQGFIDKYMGDGIMALFGQTPNTAVQAGVEMLRSLHEFNAQRSQEQREPISIGIGINTGQLMLGTVGGPCSMSSTVISDAVNLAARLEKLTKRYGISLVISGYTYGALDNPQQFAIRWIGQAQVKGKSEMIAAYEVFEADPLELKAGKRQTQQIFEEACKLHHQQQFNQAQQLFEQCLAQVPGDEVARNYLDRYNTDELI